MVENLRELAGKVEIAHLVPPDRESIRKAPDALRSAADEIERLRAENERLQDGSLRQYLTDQNTQLREQMVIVCDENEHLQRENERLQRVVDQAIKAGGFHLGPLGICNYANNWVGDVDHFPDLAAELKEATNA